MPDRSDDWNALFDPATEVLELRRIAADHPEFSEQATQHLNWVASDVGAISSPPVYGTTPAAVYVVPAPSSRAYALTTGGRVLWLVTGVVWALVYAIVGLLPVLGVDLLDILFPGAAGIGVFDTSFLATLGIEGVSFLLAVIASIVAGRTIARKVGGVAAVVIGFLAFGLLMLFMPQLVVSAFALGFNGFEGAGLLIALYTALPVAVEVLVGVIAYAISGDRKWHVLWTVPITLALIFGSFLLGDPLLAALGMETAGIVMVVIGVAIRLLVVLLAAAFGRRVESEIQYDAPAFAPPRY